MRASNHHTISLCALLTALALFAPVVPDILAPWQDGHGHGHGHGHDHGTEAGEWVYRSNDHARHDALQLEAAFLARHEDCSDCAGRTRPDDPLLSAPVTAARHQTDIAAVAAVEYSVSTLAPRQSRPRGPPVV